MQSPTEAHEILLVNRKEDKDGWLALFRLHHAEDLNDIFNAPKGSRWELRYLGDD